jgi:hypothetical protein
VRSPLELYEKGQPKHLLLARSCSVLGNPTNVGRSCSLIEKDN